MRRPLARLFSLALLAGAASSKPAAADAPRAEASLATTRDPASTEEAPARQPAASPSRFALGLGLGLTWGLGEVWESEGDVISNGGSPIFLDLSVAPSYRVASDFALGLRAGIGLEPGSRGEVSSSGGSVELDRQLWHLSATGRYQPQIGRSWYVALSAGTAAIIDSRGNTSVSQWAPLLGAAAGYDLSVAGWLSLAPELRAAYAPFGEGSRDSLAGYYDYRVSTWLGAGVVGNILP